jgi:hypothetical protein
MFGLSGRQIFILLVLIAFLFAATQYGPAYFAAFQFNDFIRQEVKFAVTNRKTPDRLRLDIAQKASDLGIPVKPRDIHITRRGPSFTVELEYHFPINMRVYRHELVFHASESGEIFENASH